jgi:hypothetical protein
MYGYFGDANIWIGLGGTPPFWWEALASDIRWWFYNNDQASTTILWDGVGPEFPPGDYILQYEITEERPAGEFVFRYRINGNEFSADIPLGNTLGVGLIEFTMPEGVVSFEWSILTDGLPKIYNGVIAIGQPPEDTGQPRMLRWSQARTIDPRVESYKIYRGVGVDGALTLLGTVEVNFELMPGYAFRHPNRYMDNTADGAVTYRYRVDAICADGRVLPGNILLSEGGGETPPPDAPELGGSYYDGDGYLLTWTEPDSVGSLQDYLLYRSTDGVTYDLRATIAFGSLTFEDDTALTPPYWWYVIARNFDAQLSVESNIVQLNEVSDALVLVSEDVEDGDFGMWPGYGGSISGDLNAMLGYSDQAVEVTRFASGLSASLSLVIIGSLEDDQPPSDLFTQIQFLDKDGILRTFLRADADIPAGVVLNAYEREWVWYDGPKSLLDVGEYLITFS